MSTWHPSTRHRIIALLIGGFLAACVSNPTAPAQEEHEEATADLVVELTLSSAHVHILSDLTYTVSVTDHEGNPVTDFDTLRVERRAADSDIWRGTDLELHGTSYTGTYTFMSSGEYAIRVSGRRDHDASMVAMHSMPEMLHTARAHAEAGGYRIEFETFPGHLHENDTGTVKFWVMEQERNADGIRPAIADLVAEIHCLASDGSQEAHVAAELEPGVYQADHTFVTPGDFVGQLHFTGSDGLDAEAGFTTQVAHGH